MSFYQSLRPIRWVFLACNLLLIPSSGGWSWLFHALILSLTPSNGGWIIHACMFVYFSVLIEHYEYVCCG